MTSVYVSTTLYGLTTRASHSWTGAVTLASNSTNDGVFIGRIANLSTTITNTSMSLAAAPNGTIPFLNGTVGRFFAREIVALG